MSFCSWAKAETYKDHFESGTVVFHLCIPSLLSFFISDLFAYSKVTTRVPNARIRSFRARASTSIRRHGRPSQRPSKKTHYEKFKSLDKRGRLRSGFDLFLDWSDFFIRDRACVQQTNG